MFLINFHTSNFANRINPSSPSLNPAQEGKREEGEKGTKKKKVLTSEHNSPYHCHQTPTQTYSSAASGPKPQSCPADPSTPSSPGSSAAVRVELCVGGKETHAAAAGQVAASPFRSSSAERCIWYWSSCRRTSGAMSADDCCCPTRWPIDGV